jgi:hypothetical protein
VNWADFVAGANLVAPLSPKIAFMMTGDAGGGGANVDYQVAGMLNYQIRPKWGIGVGYRYNDVNCRNSNQAILDVHQSGVALTLLYKYGKQPPVQQVPSERLPGALRAQRLTDLRSLGEESGQYDLNFVMAFAHEPD